MRSPLLLAGPLFLVATCRLLSACNIATDMIASEEDQCTLGQMRCTQGVVETCDESLDKLNHHTAWDKSVTCGGPSLCVASSPTDAFCVLVAGKYPACSGGSGTACDGDHLVSCKEGYTVFDLDCAKYDGRCASASTAACVGTATSTDPTVLCERQPAPMPLLLCRGDTLVDCEVSTAGQVPPFRTSACPGCRLLAPLDTTSGLDVSGCGPALGEACGAGWCALPPEQGVQTLTCHNDVCTVACSPPADGKADPCQTLVSDPKERELLSPLLTITSGSCGADGYCVWR